MLPSGKILQRRPSIQVKLQHVQVHRCVQTRRGALRTEPMPARAKPDRRSQFNFVSQLEGAKLLGILGQEVVGGREATPGHPEPVQLGLQNEFGAAGVRSRVPASGIRRQDTLEAADLGRGRSGLVRRFLGHFHGASRLGQIRRDEQGHRQRPPQRATFALVQQERATRLRRRLLGQSLAVHAKIRPGR